MQETIIDLIRHGEPEGGSCYRGHNIDDPLSELGWSQMWGAVGSHSPWQQIVSSPLSRCSQFANELSNKYDIAASIEENLKEIGFGEWEGKTREQIQQQNLQQYEDFYNDPVNCRPHGAETLDSFIARVANAYTGVLEQHQGKHCLIVAHAGVIRAVISQVLTLPSASMYQIAIKNAGITRIIFKNNRTSLEFINQTMDGMTGV